MSPVSPVFHTEVTVRISLETEVEWEYLCHGKVPEVVKGGCVSRTPWSCRKFSLLKIMESPWQEGITRLPVENTLWIILTIML